MLPTPLQQFVDVATLKGALTCQLELMPDILKLASRLNDLSCQPSYKIVNMPTPTVSLQLHTVQDTTRRISSY